MPIAQPQNGVVNAADALGKLAPIFLGTGRTTGSTQTGASADALAANNQVLELAIQRATDPAYAKSLVDNIMTRASQLFATTAVQQNGAGLYNSSVLTQLKSEAMARATGEASQAVLTSQDTNLRTAAGTADSRLAATKVSNSNSKTGPSVPSMALLGLSALGTGARIINNKDAILKAIGLGGGTERTQEEEVDLANRARAGKPPVPEAEETPADATAVDGEGTSLGTFTDETTVSIDATPTAFEAPGSAVGAGADIPAFDPGIFDSEALGVLGAGVAEDAAGIGQLSGEAVGVGPAVGVGDALAGGDVLGAVSAGEGAVEGAGAGDAVAEVGAAAWIICTELHRQKRLPTRFYYYGAKRFASYPEHGKAAYYLWAVPCVHHLRRNPDSYFSKFLEIVFNRRAEHLAALAGCRNAKRNAAGAISEVILYSTCWVLTYTVVPFMRRKLELKLSAVMGVS